jgi:hypothetical protein
VDRRDIEQLLALPDPNALVAPVDEKVVALPAWARELCGVLRPREDQ